MTEANRGRGRGGRERGRGRMVDPENDLNQRHRDPKDIEIEEQRQRIEDLERRLALAENGDPTGGEEESDSVTKEEEGGDNPFWNRGRNQGFRPRGQSTPTFGMKLEIPEFEGNSHPDEFVDWLQTVERVFDLKDIEDGQRVKLVAIRLREQASVWWEHVRRKRAREGKPKVKTWEKMKKLLKRKYLPSHYRQEALNENHLFRQRELNIAANGRRIRELECQLAEARRGSTRGSKRGQKVTEHDADREARRNQQLRREVIQENNIRDKKKEAIGFVSRNHNRNHVNQKTRCHDDGNLFFGDWERDYGCEELFGIEEKEFDKSSCKHERSSCGRKAQREPCWEDENNEQANPNLFDSFETCVVDSMLLEVNALPNFDQEFESQESRDSKADEVQNDLDNLADHENVVVWDEDSNSAEEEIVVIWDNYGDGEETCEDNKNECLELVVMPTVKEGDDNEEYKYPYEDGENFITASNNEDLYLNVSRKQLDLFESNSGVNGTNDISRHVYYLARYMKQVVCMNIIAELWYKRVCVVKNRIWEPRIGASVDQLDSMESHDQEADGYSIYLKGLPMNATEALLEEVFTKFGAIKKNGIQVRSNRQQGFCFGFVEFEEASSLQKALEASPVAIGERQVFAEEKRSTGSRGNNRGRFQQPGRSSGFRNKMEDKVWKPGITDSDLSPYSEEQEEAELSVSSDEDIQDSRTNLFPEGEYDAVGIG